MVTVNTGSVRESRRRNELSNTGPIKYVRVLAACKGWKAMDDFGTLPEEAAH